MYHSEYSPLSVNLATLARGLGLASSEQRLQRGSACTAALTLILLQRYGPRDCRSSHTMDGQATAPTSAKVTSTPKVTTVKLNGVQENVTVVRKTSPRSQLSLLPSLIILGPILLALAYLSLHLHYTLPTPQAALFTPDGLIPQFSETEAMKYINALATHEDGEPRYRIVGTPEMVETERYLVREVERIREEVVARTGGLHQIEVFHQVRARLFPLLRRALTLDVARVDRFRRTLVRLYGQADLEALLRHW